MGKAHSAGKGDQPRTVDKKKYDRNFDAINWKRKREEEKKKRRKRSK